MGLKEASFIKAVYKLQLELLFSACSMRKYCIRESQELIPSLHRNKLILKPNSVFVVIRQHNNDGKSVENLGHTETQEKCQLLNSFFFTWFAKEVLNNLFSELNIPVQIISAICCMLLDSIKFAILMVLWHKIHSTYRKITLLYNYLCSLTYPDLQLQQHRYKFYSIELTPQ